MTEPPQGGGASHPDRLSHRVPPSKQTPSKRTPAARASATGKHTGRSTWLPGRTRAHPALQPMPGLGRPQSAVVQWGWYVDGVRQAGYDMADATHRAVVEGEGFVWLGLHDPTDQDMAYFGELFGLHPLAMEDAVEGHKRSKLEQFGNTLFAVVSTVAYVEHEQLTDTSEIVSTGQVMVFVGEHFVMTVRRGRHSQLSGLRARLESDPQRMAEGPSTVLYGILDKIVDDYMLVVSDMEDDVEEVEAAAFADDGSEHDIGRVYQLKRELIAFKRAVVPLGAPLSALATRPFPGIPETARAYFREVADHHLEARESVMSFDEVLTTILQFEQTRVSVIDNQDMRKISALVAMAALPTMLAGIYGMNFDNMPELHQRYGYFVVIGVMLLSIVALYIGFRRNKWL